MTQGTLAVVEQCQQAVNDADTERLCRLSTPDIAIAGPRGSGVAGHQVLVQWLGRAGLSWQPRRWFCGGDGVAVVEHDAQWRDAESGVVQGEAVVASHFVVRDGRVASYARYDQLDAALAAAGLDTSAEVSRR